MSYTATLGCALERRQYQNCPGEVRPCLLALAVCWHGTPRGCLPIWEAAERFGGFVLAKVDGLMWSWGWARHAGDCQRGDREDAL